MSTATKTSPKQEKPTGTSVPARSHHRSKTPHTSLVTGGLESVQQSAGNLAVQQLFRTGAIKAKLSISQPNDPDEQEADRVADRIMRMEDPGTLSSSTDVIHRKCASCGGTSTPCPTCEAEPRLQRKAAGESSSSVPHRPAGLAGSGQPLPTSVRAFFEPRFGLDFSRVRVHDDASAAESARGIHARAFTAGRHVAFAAGEYAPYTSVGLRLLAHELAHVEQQRDPGRLEQSEARLQRIPDDTSSGAVPAPAVRHDCDINDANPIIWFDYDSINIRTTGGINSIVHLMAAIRRTQAHITAAGASAKIYLYGYASEEGDPGHNLDLSQRRAGAIKSLMEDAGIASANLEAVGLGEDVSMVPLPLNRRVEICPTPAIEYIDMPEEIITADTVDCDNPTQASNLTQYAFLVRCLETQLASTHGPVDILRTLRELYYGGERFDAAACGDTQSGTISHLNRTVPTLMTALRDSKVTGGLDVGHIFTGLEAMLCPRTSTDVAWYAPTVNMSNEDFLSWGGDIGSAAAGRLRGYNDSGIIFKSDPSWSHYFLTTGTLASEEDLLGDIDAFVIRTNLRGVPCASTKDTRMPSPSAPISLLLLEFYSAPPGMASGLTAADRFPCFARAVGGSVVGSSISNKSALVNRYKSQVYSFAHLFYLGMSTRHVVTMDTEDIIKLAVYSEEITDNFFDWVESRL